MMNPLASAVVKQVMEVVDVDGIVRRIDVNDAVQRIDMNEVLSKIDMNQVLSRIDWNTHLARINFDSVLAKSSTGIFTTVLDTLRTQLVLVDLQLWIVSRCGFWTKRRRQRCYLPPAPGRHFQRDDRRVYPKGRANKAVAVQGRYCGFVSKAIAMLIDLLAVMLLFGLLFRMIEWFLILFLRNDPQTATETADNLKQDDIFMILLYCIFWYGYFFLMVALAGQTIGMMVVGLKVCNCDRSKPYHAVTVTQAFVRTCLLPVTVVLLPPFGVIGLARRDGRMLHDLIAKTGMIYLWDAKLAKLRIRAEQPDEDETDELDQMMEEAEGQQQVLLGNHESGNGGVSNAPKYNTFLG
jgi:uncharacterized RDD family membrane protein YckC